jgi:hypothetical protein
VSDRAAESAEPATIRRLLAATARWSRFAYWAAVAVLFTCAIWWRFRLPLEPIADPDTWGYLSPAVGKLIGTGFAHHLRNYFYPGFLFLVLRTFGDFRSIVVVQHLLGLAAGGIFLLVWQRIRSFTASPCLPRQLHAMVGLVGAAIYLIAQEPIRFETDIRPEGITSFLVILNIFLIVEFAYRCFLRGVNRIPVKLGVAAVVSAILLTLAKPSFAIAAAGALAPVAAALFCPFPRKCKIALLIGSSIAAVLLVLPAQLLARGDKASEAFLPTQLFVIHADLIRDQIAADVSSAAETPYSREWLRRVQQMLATETTKAATEKPYNPTLGFNPDYLMYNPTSLNSQMRREFGDRLGDLYAFYWFYYNRVWTQQPQRMVGKISRQMLVFYCRVCPAYVWRKRRLLSEEYSDSLSALEAVGARRVWIEYEPVGSLIGRTTELAQKQLVVPEPRFLRRCRFFLARTYLLAVGWSVAVCLTLLYHRRLRRRLGLMAAVVLFLCWYNFGNCIEIAVIHTLDNFRYDTIQLIFTLLAQFAAFLLIAQCAFEIGRSVCSTLSDDLETESIPSASTGNRLQSADAIRDRDYEVIRGLPHLTDTWQIKAIFGDPRFQKLVASPAPKKR